MCRDFRAFNRLTIKDKLPNLVVDDVFYELHGTKFLTKLDRNSRYHQIIMKKTNIDKKKKL